jgi:hypothetical protein
LTEEAERRRPVSFWPTANQERLLTAAFGPDDEARGAWRDVRPRLDLDRLEPGTFALMPLLYRRLEAWRTPDPWFERLKGLYRHTWSRNQLMVTRVQSLAASLQSRSVEFLLGGGSLLLMRFYADSGLRPTDRVDFLVRGDHLRRAAEALQEEGWPATDVDALAQLERRPSTWFGDGRGSYAVLHRATGDEWADATTLRLVASECQALSAARQLLRTCTSDERHYRWGRVQWVADVHGLARSGEVDWDKVVDARAALAYARDAAWAPIPRKVAGRHPFVAARRLALRRR